METAISDGMIAMQQPTARQSTEFCIPRQWLHFVARAKMLAALAAVFLFTAEGTGAEPASEVEYPLVVINCASIQRIRDNAGTMFDAAGQAQMTDRVDQWMVDTLKETKGMDRTRPFGSMLYLSTELFGPPIQVIYLPVTHHQDALATLSYGTGVITQVEGDPNRHEIEFTIGDDEAKVRTLYRDGYLFVVGPGGSASTLKRVFPDPQKMTARISSQYDIAVSLMIKTVPPGMKTFLMAYFKNQWQAELQQRDEEPESVYRFRRANGEFWIDLIEKVINQGEELSIGARMDAESQTAFIEVEAAGTRDSKLAKFFQSLAGKKTYFGNLLTNPSTLTMSLSLVLEERQRKLFSTFFEAALKDVGKDLNNADKEDFQKIVDPLFKTLINTADVGHVDAVVQVTGNQHGEYALIGGVKLSTSRELPARFEELLDFCKDLADDDDPPAKLELGFELIDSHPVHRMPIPVDSGGERMFGKSPFLYLHANPQSVWGAFGSKVALESLKEALQQVSQPQDPAQGRNRVPFQIVMHARNWVGLIREEGDANEFKQRADVSFQPENDAMTIDVRPTDRGLRLRTEFQSGFIALMGRQYAHNIENGFFRGPRGRQQGQQPEKVLEEAKTK